MLHGLKKLLVTALEVGAVGMPKGGVGGRLGRSDAHHDGRIR